MSSGPSEHAPRDTHNAPVPRELIGERVEMRYVHDGEEQIAVGILQLADGGYGVTDDHRVVPIVGGAVLDVRLSTPDGHA